MTEMKTQVLIDAELAKELAEGKVTPEMIVIRHALTIMRLRAALQEIAGMEGEEGIDDHKFAERALKIANDALAP